MGEFRIAMVVRNIINADKARIAEAELAMLGAIIPVANRRSQIAEQMESCIRRLAGAITGDMDVEIAEANRVGRLDLMLPMYDALKTGGHFADLEKAHLEAFSAANPPQ